MRIITTDIYEGAYLLSKGMALENIWEDKRRGKRVVIFEFAGSDIELMRREYLRGRAQANVIRFKNSINELKDIMFSCLRDNELTPNIPSELTGQGKEERRGGLRNEVHRIAVSGNKAHPTH